MLIKKELATLPAPSRKGKKGYVYPSFAELPKSGKIMYLDCYDGKGKFEGRVFHDGANGCSSNAAEQFDNELFKSMKRYFGSSSWYFTDLKAVDEFLGVKDSTCWGNPLARFEVNKRWNKQKLEREKFEERFNSFKAKGYIEPKFSKREIQHINRFAAKRFASNYAFIMSRKTRECICGKCHKTFVTEEVKKVNLKGTCPKCGADITYVTEKTPQKPSDNTTDFVFISKKRGAVLICGLSVLRIVSPEKTDYSFAVHKVNIYPDKGEHNYLYCWSQPLFYGDGFSWSEQKNETVYETEKNFCTTNLKEVFGESWHGVNISQLMNERVALASSWSGSPDYLINNAFHGTAEYFCKSKLKYFAFVNPYFLRKMKPKKGEKPCFSTMFRMLPNMKKVYQDCQVTPEEHLNIFSHFPNEYISGELVEKTRAFGIRSLSKEYTKLGFSFKKIVSYAERQSKVTGQLASSCIISHADYLEMCKKMGVDTTHKDVKFPANIVIAHDRLLDQINREEQARKANALRANVKANQEKYAELQHRFEKVNEKLEKLDGYTNGIYEIVLPQSYDDFIKEATSLDNCVARSGYYEKHASAQSHIFFVRRSTDPDRPFFCMELSPLGYISQLHGYKNCNAPQDVRSFALSFLDKYKLTVGRKTAIA